MFNIFLLLALIIFIVVSYRRPLWGLASIVALLPSYLWRIDILVLPTTFLELMIIFLFLIWLIKDKKYSKINFSLKAKAENKIPPSLGWLLLLWLAASLIALAVNPTYAALGLWRAYFLEPMMFFVLFVYLIKDKKDLNIIFKALGILVAYLFTLAMYQNFSSWNFIAAYNHPNILRLTSVFSYPNALSLLTAPLSVFFFGLWLRAKSKWWYLTVAIMALALAYLAVSEGALLAILFSLFIYLILVKKIRKISIPVFVVVLLAAMFLSPLGKYPAEVWQQLTNPSADLAANSLEIRSWQWQETGLMLGDNFIFGSGINGYQAAMEKYHQVEWIEVYLYPHNIFLNFWTELGLLGLLVFIGLLFYVSATLKILFDQKNKFAWAISMSWLTWFVHGLVDVPYFKNDLSILFFILLGLTLVLTRIKDKD